MWSVTSLIPEVSSAILDRLSSRALPDSRAAIREVDPYHMVIIEGNHLTTDFSMLSQPLSTNQAYSFHTYDFLTNEVDTERISKLVAERAIAGMDEFLTAIKTDETTIVQEMAAILAGFAR